ncbi:MAG TPA: XRE family transcriptional regulator [Candidatus Nitrosocosmicus sp.]|nr:XRE family transcriptional regulator [Candidatus Nitrosocosmicus sp.]
MHKEIGEKINELRSSKGMTLKELGDKANLSVSFLSQAERGLTSITINSLKKIAEALDVDMNNFFTPPKSHRPTIIRSYEHEVIRIDESNLIYHNLGSEMPERQLDPVIVTILPSQATEEVIPYEHQGEEFVYVLEGIFTIFLEDRQYELYPGDSIHISSTTPHNWANFTNKLVKILAVSTPSVLK